MNKILFLPIDIDLPDLNFPILKDTKSNLPGSSFWTYENLADNNKIRNDIDESKIPFKNVIEQLPLIDIHIARLSIQDKIVTPHIDINLLTHKIDKESYDNIKKNEPCGYRLVIDGSPTALKLISNGKVISTYLPKIPMVYVISSTAVPHFIDNDIGRKTLYVRGTINEVKHQILINTSLEKYRKFCVYEY